MLALAQRLPVYTQTTCCSFNQSTTQRLHHRDNQQLCLLGGGGWWWGGGGWGRRDGGVSTGEEIGDSGSVNTVHVWCDKDKGYKEGSGTRCLVSVVCGACWVKWGLHECQEEGWLIDEQQSKRQNAWAVCSLPVSWPLRAGSDLSIPRLKWFISNILRNYQRKFSACGLLCTALVHQEYFNDAQHWHKLCEEDNIRGW